MATLGECGSHQMHGCSSEDDVSPAKIIMSELHHRAQSTSGSQSDSDYQVPHAHYYSSEDEKSTTQIDSPEYYHPSQPLAGSHMRLSYSSEDDGHQTKIIQPDLSYPGISTSGSHMRLSYSSEDDGHQAKIIQPDLPYPGISTSGSHMRLSYSSEDDGHPAKIIQPDFSYPGISTSGNGCERLTDSEEEQISPMTAGMNRKRKLGAVTRTSPQKKPLLGSGVADSFLKPEAQPIYNDVASKMMARMGYKAGEGLGKNKQGRVNIVEASNQRGRRGLGHTVHGFEASDVQWNYDKEDVTIKETVEWITCPEATPSLTDLRRWMEKGPKKMTIDDEVEFCDPRVLSDMLQCKNVFDNLEGEEMRRARTKSNPYETIRGVFFQNRAAVKMANIDAMCDFMFTCPKDKHGKLVVGQHDLLYFADVCSGPGGFSEYVLWRKKLEAKGFGFTLKGPCDFKLEEFFAASSEFFEPHYGKGGLEGDGDIYEPENLVEFRKFVMDSTHGNGVHFVMADGGFSVEGQENLQEILSKRLYLCQFLCALSLLRQGGHFVCKLFDLFTPFSVGLVYLMYRVFDAIAIVKPVTSRPANSERYIICKGLRESFMDVHDYFFEVNLALDRLGSTSSDDVQKVVPLEVLKNDNKFIDYIVSSNNMLGKKQAIGLSKIQAFAQNSKLHEPRQAQIREECLKEWQLPDQVRTAPDRSISAQKRYRNLIKGNAQEYRPELEKLDPDNLKKIHSVYDYRCIPCGKDTRWLLLSAGNTHVYKWDGRASSKWRKVDFNEVKIQLPQDTIVEAEFVQELKGEGKGQKKVNAVHIVDAMFLYGVDIREKHFTERAELLNKFVRAITRPSRHDLSPIRVRDNYRFEEIEQIFQRLDMKRIKGSGAQQRLCYHPMQEVQGRDYFFLPTGIYFIKTIREPWSMAFSRQSRRKYFYNTLTRESTYNCPPNSVASFRNCQESRLHWRWEEGVKVHDLHDKVDLTKLSRDELLHFVQEKTGKRPA